MARPADDSDRPEGTTYPLHLWGTEPLAGWEDLLLDEEGFLGADETSPSGDRLRLWFSSESSRSRVAARLTATRNTSNNGSPCASGEGGRSLQGLTVEPGGSEPPRDWTAPYRRFFRGVQAGGFFIHPPGIRPEPGLRSLVLVPGPAFGTGMHATTRMMLEAVAEDFRYSRARAPRILDVGTGSGILAVAAAMLGARTVVGLDRDPAAVHAARETGTQITENRILFREGDFRCLDTSDALDTVAPEGFDLILANLSAALVGELWEFAARRLRRRGRLIVSGFLQPEAEKVLETFPPDALRLTEIRAELPQPPDTDTWLAATLTSRRSSRRKPVEAGRTPNRTH